eukprot:GFUD01136081.1.p1 GENE.GFUD01136081.1~~GFUD01136081.1.p1  ORF type:complete len:2869 (+),score=812.68 GFUD01136081.1:304-8910(+)
MQHVLNLKTKTDPYKTQSELIENHFSCENSRSRQEEDITKLVECMALNSASTSEEEESEVSEVDSFLIEEGASGSGSEAEPEPEFLLSRAPPHSPEPEFLGRPRPPLNCAPHSPPPGAPARPSEPVDPETQARLEALLEAAGISRLTGESKQLADPDVLKRLTSSVSSALDEAAAALTRMRSEPAPDGRSLVAACSEGDIGRVRRLLDEGRVSVHETTEEGESLLSLACSAGYYELAQVLLAMRANVEDRGMKGDCTPLMEAASAGHTDIVRLLIAHGADVNAQSSSGNTPLMYACAGGHEEVVRVLLEAGANVEDHNENGHTPLMEAASAGHCGVAKILLEFGAGINTHSNEFKESALTLACYKGHLEMVRFLLEAGADQEHKTDEMHTALMEASMDGHVEVARLLLDSGAQVNMPADSFESPLTLAACGGHVELAMLLLERGANIEEVNDEGYTPLMEASREGHEEMVALLLSQGADINAQTEETQETALTLACCGGFLEVADFLIKAGADLELGASTPLMEASQEGHLELVRYLLEAGAGVNATTGTGDTALTYACENGHTDVADLLLQYSAQLEHESEGGRTPLMKAARAGHLCTVQFLISRGADVNRQTTNNDHTPLSLACAGGHLAVVEVLLQQGADPFHKLKDNSTMLIEAAKGGHTTVVQMLIDYPNSLVNSSVVDTGPPPAPAPPMAPETDRVPPPGSEALTPPKSVLRKSQAGSGAGAAPHPSKLGGQSGTVSGVLPDSGYDFLEGSGFVLEGLEEKGLDAKSYIQTMLRRTEGSSKEEQIIQKEQILAELQRVEKELQEKAQAQLLLPAKRECGDGGEEPGHPGHAVHSGTLGLGTMPPFTFQLPDQPGPPPEPVIQNLTNMSISGGRSLANIPPSERPKAKPSRKIDGKGAKKSQLQAALQQHSQQLAQLQQLQQLNQQLQQQVLQQRQLKQQNQATLAALQQNAVANQQQLAALQQNVTQLQQLEQTILAQQTTPHNQQHQQLQQRVQQILQQKQQLQQQIKQFQQQVEQQLAYTQHAGPVLPPPLPQGPPPGKKSSSTSASMMSITTATTTTGTISGEGGGGDPPEELDLGAGYVDMASETVQTTDLNFLMCGEQLQGFMAGPGGVPAGIDPSLLTSAAFELVQASQALQAVQAVQPLLHAESPPMMTPLTQDPSLLSSMDPAQIAAAVQHCPIPLDSALQVSAWGPLDADPVYQVATSGGAQVQLQYSTAMPGSLPSNGVLSSSGVAISGSGTVAGVPLLTDCSQHTQPITNFGHQLLLPTQFAFGPGQGLPVLEAAGSVAVSGTDLSNSTYGLQLQSNSDLAHLGFPQQGQLEQAPHEKKKTSKKKAAAVAHQQISAGIQATAGLQGGMLDNGGYAGHYIPGNGYTTGYAAPQQPGVPVVDLDSETDSNHDTALTLACAGGHEELVTLLLSRGADIEHRDKKGFTPLILAATAGHDKVVEILLNHGADIEAQSERTKDTPLSLACSGGRYEVVEILLSRGANKEHRNVSDYTPLSLAASGGYTNIIKLLLAHGAEINSRTGSKLGISPLMLAAMNGHTAAVKLLLDMGSDINAQIETNRNTALTLACFQGRHEVVSLLLDRKANVEHRAKTGLTPLMEAASGGYTEVGRVLLDKGADVNAAPVPSSRDTALTIAADKGHYRFVELLLSRGAQVDVRNKKGNSSLWLAANGGHLDVVQLLYSAGADIDSQDNRKVSCLMAAFRKGHSKVVKWLVKHVTQFPSDTELTRFIATISDKDLLKKTHQCLEIIRVAKERQASEANKAASILLEELEQEKTREESKKAAAARKREKKKRRKAEKRGKIEDEEEDIEDEDKEEMKENGDATTEDEKEKSPEINAEGDSGIDANSQGSAASNDKEEKTGKKKKNKKKNKEKNDKNSADNNSEEKENNNLVANRGDSKEKSPGDDEDRPDSRSDRNSQPRVPCTIEGHSIPEVDKTKSESGFIEPIRKGRNRVLRQSDSISEAKVEAKAPPVNNSKKSSGAGGKAAVPDAGWKEVVRKSKKVSVPSNAISRVIGRGGSNINAIRELSGAHIEVEKQSKGQGDRTILIKGSAEATRLANTWISAIIASPDKDLAEIVGRQQYKTLSSVNLNKTTVVVTKTVVKTIVTTTAGMLHKSKSAEMKKTLSAAAITTATKMTLTYTGPVMTAKTKPVTSTSFAAIAAGNDGFGMIPTGPPPASAIKASISSSKPSVPMPMGKMGGKKEDAVPPLMPASSSAMDSKDYSPFKTFKMPGSFVNWGNDKSDQFKGFATPASSAPNTSEDLAKAPGYRSAQSGLGSPGSSGSVSSVSSWSGINVVSSHSVAPPHSAAPGFKKVTTSSTETTTQLYPTQERCNSAPGTPVSPLVPSPIAPPANPMNNKNNNNNSSPGSEPDWFRPPGPLGSNLRSMTPDGDLDRGWGGMRNEEIETHRRHGTGSYGHNSPAKAPGAPLPDLFGRGMNSKVDPTTGLATESLLSAAAQLSSLSNNYDLLTSTPSSMPVTMAPGIPMPDNPTSFSGFGGSGRFGPSMSGGPRFTQPTQANTTAIFSQPPMSVPSAGLPKGLNPNAPDFNRSGLYGNIRGNMARAPQNLTQQQKLGSNFGGYNNFGGNNFSGYNNQGGGNFQNILTNQGINAYLSTLNLGGNMAPGPGPAPPAMDMSALAGLADLNLSGRTLSELTDMLGPEAVPGYPTNSSISDMEPKFSRPIGAERRTGPSPLGHSMGPGAMGNMGPQARKVDPFGVWDLPPSYSDNISTNLAANDSSFSLLPPSLSGQTLQSALDNLSKGGFNDLQFNGGHLGGVGGVLDPGSLGGQTPSSGFGLSPALTPSKIDYSDWGTGSTSGSAPGSANKNNIGDPYRGDPAQVRRNMNQMWPKEWEN